MQKDSVTGRILKRIVPLLLVTAFLYNIFGYFVVFQVNRARVRSEMKQQLAAADRKVHVLRIFEPEKTPSFSRIHAKEFCYKGQMFDVLREVSEGRTTTFYCLRDVKEELLMAGLRKTANSKESQNLVYHLITLAMPVTYSKALPQMTACITYSPVKDPLAERPHTPFPPPPEVG